MQQSLRDAGAVNESKPADFEDLIGYDPLGYAHLRWMDAFLKVSS